MRYAPTIVEQPRLSLVLPAYNEQVRMPAALKALAAFAHDAKTPLEAIVVDDGGSDETPRVVKELAAELCGPDFGVRLIQVTHRGKGAAVRAGMQEVRAPIVGFCDVDLSAGPDAFPKLLHAIENGADLAIASRGLPESVLVVRQPWFREAGGKLFNFTLRKLAGISQRDTQCGLKLLRRAPAMEIFRHQRLDGFAFDAEIVVLAVRLGYRVDEVPVRWSHATGSKVSILKDGLRMNRDILRIVRRLRHGVVHELGVPGTEAIEMMASAEDKHWWHVSKRRLVAGGLSDSSEGRTYLDVGCGAGAMLAALKGATCVGVDLSPEALSHAGSRGLKGLVRAEAGVLPFKSNAFDAAMALDVVEHHARPERLLREISRVLKSDGKLIVTVPAFEWMWSYADHVLGHYRRYTKDSLANELISSRFEIERITYFHSWLLPIAWTFRRLRALLGRADSPDDFMLPEPINRFFLKVASLEFAFLYRRNLPFGLSLMAVARPKQEIENSATGPDLGHSRLKVAKAS